MHSVSAGMRYALVYYEYSMEHDVYDTPNWLPAFCFFRDYVYLYLKKSNEVCGNVYWLLWIHVIIMAKDTKTKFQRDGTLLDLQALS